MKSFRLIVVGAALALGSAVAGAQATQQGPTQPQVQQQGARRHGPGKHLKGPRGAKAAKAMFKGVNLTDAQKTQLKAVRAKYRPEREALHKQVKDRRASGQQPDSTFRASVRSQARSLHERQLADVRAILTPAQRTTFDANLSAQQAKREQRKAERAAKGKGQRQG